MIETILPPFVVSADTFADVNPAEEMLFPEEEAAITKAVDKRRNEFITARACARRALKLLGRPPAPVPPGVRGEPQWPANVIGSITHCAGYRGAVLGEPEQTATIGIDAEPNQPLPNGVLEAIGLPEERSEVAAMLSDSPEIRWDRLLFCAKEAVYKAWFPLTGRWLNFEDARVTVDPHQDRFSARLLVDGPMVNGRKLRGFSGRWMSENGLILTAIVMPRTD
ncbi:putative 4'-phosphopantetheinyl transferase [Planobispora rosea]|uniref:Putative 4'-phosphopantetheinyl transferase n=1 Tax=Planobispora rosea TaxID=35762 RepID=A0A8J3WHX9_PLARO|nr:4'-phosphopantetheinyl transferase superfamily protein [Planobispora rosea]GGT07037.1 putative 4'-phosphopantetheinyl transferase [Planobispora rosea]GIH89147.1 putative 4'-phosphopantetheinyl transferase [Planobispora rosea]